MSAPSLVARRAVPMAVRPSTTHQGGAALAPPSCGIGLVDQSRAAVIEATAHPAPASAGTIQRMPDGDYEDDVPASNGIAWDTEETTTHGGATVPERTVAVMRKPGDGGVPSVDPPGWNWLKANFIRLKGQWVRFHIINAKLGGPGYLTDNLVPTTHLLNHDAGWRALEEDAKTSANTKGKWTYVEVNLSYDHAYPDGIPSEIEAEWGQWDGTKWVYKGGSGILAQINPRNASDLYQPSTFLRVNSLKKVLPDDEAAVVQHLIDQMYQSDDEFSEAWYDENISNDLLRDCFRPNDELPGGGPYPIVVDTAEWEFVLKRGKPKRRKISDE